MLNCPKDQIPANIVSLLPAGDAFEQIMALDGVVYRDMPGRRTIQLKLGAHSYFIKQHHGVGWAEIFKNLLMLRLPIISAATEWRAIAKLDEIGIPTTPAVAYGCHGINPASMRSFVMTRDLGDIISLETLCADWKRNPPQAAFKRKLIKAVAELARTFHDSGMNHRDFYLCHFCLDKSTLASLASAHDEISLYLIDLHRVGIRNRIKPAARIKDIAGLYFSAMDAGLSKTDILRFIGSYRRQALPQDFFQRVDIRARKLYEKIHGRLPVTPFDSANG